MTARTTVPAPAHKTEDAPRGTHPTRADQDERTTVMLRRASLASRGERLRLHEEVIIAHLPLARSIAARYRAKQQDFADLFQVACLGLTKAVQRYEPGRGRPFPAFAVPTISGEVKRYLRDSSWFVRPPRQLQDLFRELRVEEASLTQSLGRPPRLKDLAKATGHTPRLIKEALACANSRQPASIDGAPTDSSDDQGSSAEPAFTAWADPGFEDAEVSITVRHACAALTRRERKVLYLRFFHDLTQTEIADECGVTQMQVSRILRRTLDQLRESLSPELLYN